jgi:hypothetical protein
MKSDVFRDEQPLSFSPEREFGPISLQTAERELIAFQRRYGGDRELAKVQAIVEQAIYEIRRKYRE